MRKKICAEFTKKGSCSFGIHCHFAHIGPNDDDYMVITSAKLSSPLKPSSGSGFPAGLKKGYCATFWTSGKCKFDFDCRFKHVVNPAIKSTNGNNAAESSASSNGINGKPWTNVDGQGAVQAVDATFPTYDTIRSRVSDGLLIPTKFYPSNKVKGVLADASHENKRLNTAALVEGVAMAINSSNNKNENWTFEERQSLLSIIAKTPGDFLLRLAEIWRWPEVTTKGANRDRISFQSCYMGVIAYYTSEGVIKSASNTHISALYGLIDNDLAIILATISESITECLQVRTFKDRAKAPYMRHKVINIVTGLQIFRPDAVLFSEYISRFRSATTSHPELVTFVSDLVLQFEAWEDLLIRKKFDDALTDREKVDQEHFLRDVKKELKLLQEAVSKSLPLSAREIEEVKGLVPSWGVIAYTDREYNGPGHLCDDGPRHDNDHADIVDMSIPPTTDELLSGCEPYTPVNLPGARHHLPADSIDKILDIQFRLLRADATISLSKGIKLVLDELDHEDYENTQMARLVRNGGGRFVGSSDGFDSVAMPLIANIQFSGIDLDHKHGLVVSVRGDAPPGTARSAIPGVRHRYWEAGKRLPMGGLVALVTQGKGTASYGVPGHPYHLVVPNNIKHIERPARSAIEFGLSFVDAADGLRAAEILRTRDESKGDIRVLLESPVLYEAVRPFLQAIQKIDPIVLPLRDYIRHNDLRARAIKLPEYATVPHFTWNLKGLLRPEEGIEECIMDPGNTNSVTSAREVLHAHGKLDRSQSDAVVDSLTREIALIQGPPGTGKTFTGVELLRLLIENGVGPIVLLAFTNHALDHILRAIQDGDVTKSMLRLGSRSKDEAVSQYSLETLERVGKKDTSLHAETAKFHGIMKDLEGEMKKVSDTITSRVADDEQILQYLEMEHPVLRVNLEHPPDFAQMLFEHAADTSGWETVATSKKSKNDGKVSMWSFWVRAMDLEHLRWLEDKPFVVKAEPVKKAANRFEGLNEEDEESESESGSEDSETQEDDQERDKTFDFMFAEPDVEDWEADSIDIRSSDDSSSEAEAEDRPESPIDNTHPLSQKRSQLEIIQDKAAFLEYFDMKQIPKVPQTTRKLEDLLEDGDVWSFSAEERIRVSDYVSSRAKSELDEGMLVKFEGLAKKHAEARTRYAEAKDNIRVKLLKGIKLLGSTTTGAAKLPTVLTGFSPQVLVIEEAGQVTEVHVLATLFPTIKHVIAIGDPLQLRPNVNDYELSVDSPKGKDMYRFDVSLMERLSSGGLPMSQLQVQRRMRPAISSLIRNTLYPKLEDHDVVQGYPDVRGMGKNLFFLDHRNRDSKSGDDGASRHNTYEVKMACDLARYLLKQGVYNQEGDIVILCAYLGQLLKVRDALKDEYMVILDERDQRELDKRGEDVMEEGVEVKRVAVGKQILLRTVDNFQGEEAKVVIVSLVRNSGDPEDENQEPASIGFLKSNNRVNVALSRAKHGMYILGNSEQLASKSPMWEKIIDELVETDSIGTGWPIACANHPETLRYVDRPGQIQLLSPDGGCMLQCGKPMQCGHNCTQKCHPDDLEHTLIKCQRPCGRLLQPCGHPCTKRCHEDCGTCEMICSDVTLPCGHKADIPCEQMSHLESVRCEKMVTKQFTTCEHEKSVPSGEDIALYSCTAACGQPRDCCGRSCTSPCHTCQSLSKSIKPPRQPNMYADPWDELAAAEHEASQKVVRNKHDSHSCGKLLEICGHQCSGKCEKDHVHPPCAAPCLQQCGHKKCAKTCKTPCAPCQEACQWSCEHRKCSMPCAMPCDRLPCDEPCKESLPCGHPCPSVCGEPCQVQTCPECASPNQQAQVVDFIMQATLAEVYEEDASTRFITLNCGHIFTVETLDGHVDLRQCYDTTDTGMLLAIRVPDAGAFTARPTCPTCRGCITSPRYNRVVKRALLDIQEQHAIKDSSRDVSRARQTISAFDFIRVGQSVKPNLANMAAPKHGKMPAPARIDSLLQLQPGDVSCLTADLFSERLEEVFYIANPLNRVFRTMLESPLRVYKQLGRIVNRGALPHVIAYESALTSIYRQELELAQSRALVPAILSSQNKIDPSERAMRVARMRVGAPFPKGELRFKIEALHETIKIRLQIAPIASEFARCLHVDVGSLPTIAWAGKNNATNATCAAKKFNILAWTILRSCRRDADLAANICRDNEAHRLALATELLVIQSHFAVIRHVSTTTVVEQIKQDHTIRSKQADWAVEERCSATNRFDQAIEQILMASGSKGSGALAAMVEETIRPTAMALFDEWGVYEDTLRMGTFYSTVSMDEKLQIAKAVTEADYGTAGRFYQCPNGHTFTIGECGQAMAQATCPECGASIGGGHHELRSDNRRDMEFERLARQAGAHANPHAHF